MTLIGACVHGGRVRCVLVCAWRGGVGGGLVVKVYGKDSRSIRGHVKCWSPCSHSGQMLQSVLHSLCSLLKRLKLPLQGPLWSFRSLEAPVGDMHIAPSHGSGHVHGAVMIQTALLIIDIIVICSSSAPSVFFRWGTEALWGPIVKYFVAEFLSRGQ